MEERVRALNAQPVWTGANYVLYWMRANRRVTSNHALAWAARLANEHGLPLLCYESFPEEANRRHRAFVLEGVPENARRLRKLGAGYVFSPTEVFDALAAEAACVVTDDFPRMADPALPVACYAVDSSCIVPMSAIEGKQYAAYAIRPKIRKLLPKYLVPMGTVRLYRRYPGSGHALHTGADEENTGVPPSASIHGGSLEAEARLQRFLEQNLHRYARHHNNPAEHANSGLSPYLHFGHISALDVALRVKEYAEQHKLIADEFIEQLIVRRELAFNFARYAARVDSLGELPEWARKTLARHAGDPRPALYSREEFVEARTHDALWNATQREMLSHGVIHGYYRMYWGKKIIEWSASYEEALATMLHIHDVYALDGRDPNTWANILWCFGLHDRPWPERPIFGMVRTMTRAGLERKTDVAAYLEEHA
jgi:deoxyribodipyrimidine photo-lyase